MTENMLTKRIVPCLDIKNGRTVKGVNFVDLRDAGDPVELAKKYAEAGADELVFLDISATQEKRKTFRGENLFSPRARARARACGRAAGTRRDAAASRAAAGTTPKPEHRTACM